ncbi:MAG: phytanoyl-CoA dioxygenase family protein [Afipia sp.]|jgi:ectoine hydroxylase-related dioxygenase (phytanoyl-CoA dioxygenase family)|uniref:phytanoyl-CoA dioxygenase family protein n=1 Tax=Sphingopyxis sp. TaxID=1908224 RepID=UPI0011D6B02D|nr:phytanoyl-CoA dioxygenase family protein [Novosphingobium sp.]TXJ12147.1 MAG: phytanoyl-CoA dioxygenase family protein [Afipia sp.]
MSDKGLRTFQRNDPFELILKGLDDDGGVIVRDFIDQDLLARLNEQLQPDIKHVLPGSDDVGEEMGAFWGKQTKRFTRLAARAPAFAELLDHDLMHRWAASQLEGDYWLNTGQAMIVGPGETGQFLHRDTVIWPVMETLGRDAPNCLVSIMLALSDFTEEVGATRVIPRSHKWDDFARQPNPDETVGAVMPAGSALLYMGKTVHGAGANVTADQWRHGLHMSFVVGWLTPEEASPLVVPWDLVRNYPPRVQRMLGYASHARGENKAPGNWLIDFEDARKFFGVPFERPTEKSGFLNGELV